MSMKPGVTTRPVASRVWAAVRRGEISDGADAVAGYPNVGRLPRLTGAVNDGSATDDEIEFHRYISFWEAVSN